MSNNATVSEKFLNSLAQQAGFSVAVLQSLCYEVESLKTVWGDLMPDPVPARLQQIMDKITTDLMEIEEMRAERIQR